MPNWAFFLLRLALGVGFSAAMTWGGWKLGGLKYALVAFVLSTPAIAVAIARPLVELIHEGFTWTSRQPLKKWEGNYYEFGGVQVRVVEDDGQLWFAADDVIKATGIAAVGGTLLEARDLPEWGFAGLGIDGVEKVLGRHRSHESGRFILWARREVIMPWERKRGVRHH
jgi:hypothetical protein